MGETVGARVDRRFNRLSGRRCREESVRSNQRVRLGKEEQEEEEEEKEKGQEQEQEQVLGGVQVG